MKMVKNLWSLSNLILQRWAHLIGIQRPRMYQLLQKRNLILIKLQILLLTVCELIERLIFPIEQFYLSFVVVVHFVTVLCLAVVSFVLLLGPFYAVFVSERKRLLDFIVKKMIDGFWLFETLLALRWGFSRFLDKLSLAIWELWLLGLIEVMRTLLKLFRALLQLTQLFKIAWSQ